MWYELGNEFFNLVITDFKFKFDKVKQGTILPNSNTKLV